ncbi:Mitochondrial import inner membrane translocase subunit TIM50 [Heracleum sosnowskyi]|uniref:Mitochondrial import inner membrane translocase subunit TIM50 n=1 Tax=Heracleum sosnowskyi TaxID=360622 RepID=A0AAD8MXE6_9APIA|nr:Mitochondrial import inner membrane translocase subunit TIM50 [Heracleum sosnowskyi]
MSAIVRARLLASVSKRFSRRNFSATVNAPKQQMEASSAAFDEELPPRSGVGMRLLKYGVFASVAGIFGTTGYATYAYSVDEIEEKTKAYRASANVAVQDDGTILGKYQAKIYSAAAAVPAKLLEVYIDGRRSIEEHVRGFTEPSSDKLLPDLHPMEQGAFTLVLDLNETLIYSDWKRDRGWRTFKRPGVDAFLEHLAKFYELVVYSDQLSMYVDPSVERLDPNHYIRFKLSRSATKYQNQKHYRDLSMLNRDPSRVLYLSGNALETSLQPENCVPIKQWKGETEDTELLDIIPFLEYVATHRPNDIRPVIASYKGRDIAKEFIERSKEVQKKLQEQKQQQQGRLWRR